jgi:glycosyltransferase involved in cell wall biosynthesis
VAVDASPAARTVVTGTELYARELCRRLPDAAPEIDWRFYASRPAPGLSLDVTVMPFPRLWSQVRLPLELTQRRPDLFFSPSHVVPVWCPAPSLTVVHDLAFARFPRAYRPAARSYLRFTTRWAELRCRQLIAVSESTRRDLAELHGVDPSRVMVVHPGGGESPQGSDRQPVDLLPYGIEGPYALHVGRIEPRKNQLAALQAVERVPGLLLVCAGAVADESMAATLRASPRCRLLGRVTGELSESLYRQAAALVFPSLYEGFGFPILEAMRNGVPVVTVRSSSLPEVAGEAALYAQAPEDVAGLAAQLGRLQADGSLRRQLARAGRDRAAAFTWQRCAAGVAEVIRSLLEAEAPPIR